MTARWVRRVLLALLLLFGLAVAGRYLPLDLLRPGIERALGRGPLPSGGSRKCVSESFRRSRIYARRRHHP